MSLRPDPAERADEQLSVEDCEILHARSGDADAFAPLMHRHYAAVLGVATRHAPATHLGEDIASETFIFAWQHFDRFTLGGDFGAWVRTIAWQIARAQRERENCRQRHLDGYARHCESAGSPVASARAQRRAAEVLDALATLRPQRRDLVLLCDYEGCTYADAAVALGRTIPWVRTTLHRTRHEVRAACSHP